MGKDGFGFPPLNIGLPALPPNTPDLPEIPGRTVVSHGHNIKKGKLGKLKDAFKQFIGKSDQSSQPKAPTGKFDPNKPLSQLEIDLAKTILTTTQGGQSQAQPAPSPIAKKPPPIPARPQASPIKSQVAKPKAALAKSKGKPTSRPIISGPHSPATAIDQISLKAFHSNVSLAQAFLKQFETRTPERKDFKGIRKETDELLSQLGEIEKQIEGKIGSEVDALKNRLGEVKTKLLSLHKDVTPAAPPIAQRKEPPPILPRMDKKEQ